MNTLWMYVLAALVIIGCLWQIFKAGGNTEKLEQAQRKLDAVVTRGKVENDVDRLSDDAVTRKLRENGWFRDE